MSAESGHLFRNLLLFGRVLRGLGLDVHAGRMLDVAQALDYIGIGRKSDFYHVLRTTLVHREQDLTPFDKAFELFWRVRSQDLTRHDLRSIGEQRRTRVRQIDISLREPGLPERREVGVSDSAAEAVRLETYSPHEASRSKDFSRFTPEEIAEARALMAELEWDPGVRLTRRWMPGRGRVPDLRRVIRRNMRYGGELVELPRRERKQEPRPLVLLCDVSGSMERYSRMLLHFIQAVAHDRDRVEAFLFATRLTRITRELGRGGVDEAIAVIPRAVPDWAGGTRIGEVLRTFNLRWGRRVLGHGAVVLLISDGWDRGEPTLLRNEMARLQRSCHRLIWLNPLLGSPAYEPLTRGMQAALPFIDDFLPVHNLTSLEALARHLNTLSHRRPARRQQISVPGRSPGSGVHALEEE